MAATKNKLTGVLEIGYLPACRHRLMTFLAVTGKFRERVIGIGRVLEVRVMANPAFLRQPRPFVPLLIQVAGSTIRNRMDAHQRKSTGGMQVEVVFAILPVLGRMTVLAAQTELPAMDIGMTIGASGPDI
jgi:hypothetical protein